MIATISRIGFHVTAAPSGLGEIKKKRFGFKYAFHMCVCICVSGLRFAGFFFLFFCGV